MDPFHDPEPPGRWRALAALAATMVLAMSTWFSTAAAMGSLHDELQLSQGFTRALIVAVQLGFVVGALTSAALSLPDRISPRRLSAGGALLVAAINLAPALLPHPAVLLAARFLVGLTIAIVCPPLLAAMATWFRAGRGVALGIMVGALTLGSAAPHLVNGIGSPSWRTVLAVTSGLAVVAAVLRWRTLDGPYRNPANGFDPSRIVSLARNRGVRLAFLGYLGHMWELYAGWAAMALYLRQVLGGDERSAALATFCVIAVGAAGSVVGGALGDRGGKARAARISLLWSGGLIAILGIAVDWPVPIVLVLALVWGFWVIADSAQFTALVTEHADARHVGTAVTIQLAGGFALTAATMWLVPIVHDAAGWAWAFALLAPGPMLASLAMRRLERTPAGTAHALIPAPPGAAPAPVLC